MICKAVSLFSRGVRPGFRGRGVDEFCRFRWRKGWHFLVDFGILWPVKWRFFVAFGAHSCPLLFCKYMKELVLERRSSDGPAENLFVVVLICFFGRFERELRVGGVMDFCFGCLQLCAREG